MPGARRFCNLTAAAWDEAAAPLPGKAFYYLVSGNRGTEEGTLDADSAGVTRPNNIPCPHGTGAVLETIVEADREIYRAADEVGIPLTAINIGDSPVTLIYGGCATHFVVADEYGVPFYDHRWHQDCEQAESRITLPPGEALEEAYRWGQTDDSGRPVPRPGDYWIRDVLDTSPPAPEARRRITLLESDPPLQALLRTDKDSYAPGEPVEIEGVLFNASQRSITVDFATCFAWFEVFDSAGSRVYSNAPGSGAHNDQCWIPTVLIPLTLEPGEGRPFRFLWNQTDLAGRAVPAAMPYRVVGTINHPLRCPAEDGRRYEFSNTCQAYFDVSDAGGAVVYSSQYHFFCGDAITYLTLSPGESRRYDFTWDQKDDGGRLVPLGQEYTIRARFFSSFPAPPTASTTISILGGPALETTAVTD